MAFRNGKFGKEDVDKLLNKHFSDKVFEDILRCNQGELEFCKKINMQKWREDAVNDI